MAKKNYNKYEDPGHGWLKVTRKELVRLGILDKITGFSYQRGDFVYLEEDCDLSTFLDAKEKIDGLSYSEIIIKSQHTNNESRIRNYYSFQA